MASVEREHKSKKEKKEKKEKREKHDVSDNEQEESNTGASSEAQSVEKKKKERWSEERKQEKRERLESEPKESRKRKLSDADESTVKARKSSVDVDIEDEDNLPRRRTRSMSEGEVCFNKMLSAEEYRKQHQISVVGKPGKDEDVFVAQAPLLTFADCPFASTIKRSLECAGFTTPTPTQAQAWPIALAGRDIITVAKTGSGKTIGFLLPAYHILLTQCRDRKRGPPAILVLAPTRELACQIEEEAVKFGRTSNIRSACCYGGSSKELQIRKIRNGIEILIATPGRLNDLIEMRNTVVMSEIKFLVLDEADRMLDMGFGKNGLICVAYMTIHYTCVSIEPQIRKIIDTIPKQRQSMMFTATWPREVQVLAREFLNNPVEIRFGEQNALNANKAIVQTIRVMGENDKQEQLQLLMKEISPTIDDQYPKTIIFVSRKSSCETLAQDLWNKGYWVDALHGDKQQFQRTKVMESFKRSQLRILVATDVAARGLGRGIMNLR